MVRNVRALVFKDISPLSEQFLDLMGMKLSVRQMAYLGISLLVGYGFSLLFQSLMTKVFVFVLFLAFGAMLSATKIKTLTPEKNAALHGCNAQAKSREEKGRACAGKTA